MELDEWKDINDINIHRAPVKKLEASTFWRRKSWKSSAPGLVERNRTIQVTVYRSVHRHVQTKQEEEEQQRDAILYDDLNK
jgi:hypothetical protein